MKFMEGYKTYTGLLVIFISSLIGMLGIADVISNDEVSQIVFGLGNIVGIIFSAYSRYTTKANLPK